MHRQTNKNNLELMVKTIAFETSYLKVVDTKVIKGIVLSIHLSGGMHGGEREYCLKGKLEDLLGEENKIITDYLGQKILVNPRYFSNAKEVKLIDVKVEHLKWNNLCGSDAKFYDTGIYSHHVYAIDVNDDFEIKKHCDSNMAKQMLRYHE